MEEQNNKRSIIDLIQKILCATGLAIAVTIATIYMLQGYETKSIVKLLVVNLIVSYFILIITGFIGESFIEDVIKAILFTLILLPLWFREFERIDYIRCVFLSIALGAWYPVVLKILQGLGAGGVDDAEYRIDKTKDERQKIIEKSLRRRKRKEAKKQKKKDSTT